MAVISSETLVKQKYQPKQVPVVSKPSIQDREKKAAENILQGMNPAKAVTEAGFNFSPIQAQKYGEKLKAKYNDLLVTAYEAVGITPEYIAGKQMEILEDEKTRPGDRLKAIEQILNVTGGFAPKQVEVAHVSFEQAVIEISQTVNLSKLSSRDVRKLLDVTDAEIIS